MDTYIDHIPKDLIFLIFYKVEYSTLTSLIIDNFLPHLLNQQFWENRFKTVYKDVNLELIPQWYYNYKNQSMKLVIYNNNEFHIAHVMTAKSIIDDLNKNRIASIKLYTYMVTNIKAYVYHEILLDKDIIDNTDDILIKKNLKGGYKVQFRQSQRELLGYDYNHNDLLNLLTHIKCNNHDIPLIN